VPPRSSAALPELFRDRDRAESFGAIAEQYDRLRPTAPDTLLDEFAALKPSRVLDIGCGTGKVARALMDRGLNVLGIEIDERMAAVARGHGVTVEIAAFEDWEDGGRTFDLITCGDAWHWIDPVRGWRKIEQVLRPGGTVARFWNHHELDEPLTAAFAAVYERCAPGVLAGGQSHHERDDSDPRTETSTYSWERTYSADDWVELAATYSSHQRLEPARLAALQAELHAAIESFGGTVVAHRTTFVSRSRAAPR
jgi:SAM-dependent methyltransferase